ncbi:Uncharacterised protein [Blautia obeum]|uniref:Uncharacterized protein n=1 Tax=Blautia obeum TaxID=40520 RepID=A0A174A328_9FIRM|nr:Uncharacterised protein [Blautia obeum]
MVYRLPIPYPRTCSSFDCYVRIFGIFNSTTVNLFPFVCWGTGYRRGFYRAAINGNITATAAVTAATNSGTIRRTSSYRTTLNGNITATAAVTAATNSGTIRRTSSYRTTLNGNITASALLAATNSSTILRTSNYRTTINNNITARAGAVIAATNSGAIPIDTTSI